ncbi:pentatricopeptide repeat-containing protein [Canna indica]|uniref:Pentatricopeptide repeat-containing protein n=1 Tax=Canna indica TaxID=4628 RepID=A0AAQ3QPJ0_9LILI|nr:pentatricopeptide repeat-containing protein [Canna indica]
MALATLFDISVSLSAAAAILFADSRKAQFHQRLRRYENPLLALFFKQHELFLFIAIRQMRFLRASCKLSSLASAFFSKLPSTNYKSISRLAVNCIDFDNAPRRREDSSCCISTPQVDEELVSRLFSILGTCRAPLDIRKCRQVHAQIVVNGIYDSLLGTKLLSAYVLCQSLIDAKGVFFSLENSSSLPWNWMIRGFTMMGCFEVSLLFYFKMWFVGAYPDKYTFPYVIKSVGSLSAVKLGSLIHGTIRLMGLETDVFIGSSLIKMYTESNDIESAREVFDRMHERDSVLWNVMIDGYVRNHDAGQAILLFDNMRVSDAKLNDVSFACVLSICASMGMLKYGTQIHGLAIKYGLGLEASVANTLLAMYSKCRCLDDVKRLFSLMPHTDLVTWNSMISGCVQSGLVDEALELFYQMQIAGMKPDSITLASFLPAFSGSASLKQGKEIHGYIIRNNVTLDVFLKSALIDIYFKCKDAVLAKKVFASSGTMDVVICSAMISGFVLNGMSNDALNMFRQLLKEQMKPNPITLASLLPAFSCLAALSLGKELHGYILKNAYEGLCYVASALIDMYTKCGRLDLGHQVFTKMPNRDAVAWNSMIASLVQNGQPEEAMNLFRQMRMEGVQYDCVTISSVLSACASLPALNYGKEIHGFMMKGDIKSDLFAVSALIDMYGKCGDLDLARRVFDSMTEKNEVSWNSLVAAYGAHGLVKEAINLFQQMQEEGFLPDHITFLALLSACGHAGQVEEGIQLFHAMHKQYGIVAHMEHYACMVDLYGRAGWFNEALELIRNMPFKPDAGIWGAVLGACRVHGYVELAELASEKLFDLDPENSGYYVLLSNIHAMAGRWKGVLKARKLMKERKIQKVPGYSWIEINNVSHMFVADDKSHPDSEHIYLTLKSLLLVLREEGYVPKPEIVFPSHMDASKQKSDCIEG